MRPLTGFIFLISNDIKTIILTSLFYVALIFVAAEAEMQTKVQKMFYLTCSKTRRLNNFLSENSWR